MPQKSSPVALISVTNKTGLTEFAKGLAALDFKILSTGGTAKLLREAGIHVTEVADFTNSPEVLGGRVKTLHPMIHGGILADRENASHQNDMARMQWQDVDMVVANLYDFATEAKQKNLPLEKAIEYIDIGGPAMLRAAAKNNRYCLPVIDNADYDEVLKRWQAQDMTSNFRQYMAAKVFTLTSSYDQMIAEYFQQEQATDDVATQEPQTAPPLQMELCLVQQLRYGENSHQKASFYRPKNHAPSGLAAATCLQGKELSYNNYIDLDAAAAIVSELAPVPAVTIIKHTNPCGTAASPELSTKDLFMSALSSDPKCAFGGIVATNVPVDESAAQAMCEIFLECVIAPEFTEGALAVFSAKKNVRVLKSNAVLESARAKASDVLWRSVNGGILMQSANALVEQKSTWTCVTKAKPTPKMLDDLGFAVLVCKHVKSNAIVLASAQRTIGIGAGQMSRIDGLKFAIDKSRELGHAVRGSIMASDAFFPFRDCVDAAANAGILGIIQPGGSLRDQESIDAANEHGIVMVTTGVRHFKH